MTAAITQASAERIVMAADTRGVGAKTGASSTVRKQFLLDDRFGVISYNGPPLDGVDVPARISSVALPAQSTLSHLVLTLKDVFSDVVGRPYQFGIWVAGFENDVGTVWHIDVPGDSDLRFSKDSARNTVAFPVYPPDIDPREYDQRWRARGHGPTDFVRVGNELAPQWVGDFVEIIEIDLAGGRWLTGNRDIS